MKTINLEERRKANRVPVDMLLNKYLKGRPYLCRATDLSTDGLLIKGILEPQSSDVHVGLQFQLPGSDMVITCAGQVVREQGWQTTYGIHFRSLTPENRALIQRYVGDKL